MTTFKGASEVIAPNQSAVVLYTRGPHFKYDSMGDGWESIHHNGTTGKWRLNLDRLEEVDKVIIYFRDEELSVNQIYLGNYIGTQPSDDPRR